MVERPHSIKKGNYRYFNVSILFPYPEWFFPDLAPAPDIIFGSGSGSKLEKPSPGYRKKTSSDRQSPLKLRREMIICASVKLKITKVSEDERGTQSRVNVLYIVQFLHFTVYKCKRSNTGTQK